MGCKQVTSKRPNERNITTLGSSKNDTNNAQAPTAGHLEVKLLVNYQGKVLLEKTYKEDVKVDSVMNEINQSIPNWCKEAKYTYIVRGMDLTDKSDSEIRSLLTASKQIKKESNEVIEVNVTLKGLEDLPLNLDLSYQNTNLIGKLLTDPFEIVIFDKENGKIFLEPLTDGIESNAEMKVFSDLSAYCNGGDHLFISGGEFNNEVILGHFWDVDLLNKTIFRHKSGLQTPRKLHSMIFVPNSYVFIVGGLNVKNVELFDTVKREISVHSKLNQEMTEPALAVVNNSTLFAFSGFLNGVNSFEKINLRSDAKIWEVVSPKLNSGLFTQNFFAVSKFSNDKVLFIGGMHLNTTQDEEQDNNFSSFVYDFTTNELEKTTLPDFNLEFCEKFLLPMNDQEYFVIPQCSRENLGLVKYSKENGLSVVQFESDNEFCLLDDKRKNDFLWFQDIMEVKNVELVEKVRNVPEVIENVPEVVENVHENIENVPEVVENVPEVVENVPEVVENVPEIVENVHENIENVPEVVENVPEIVENVPEIVENVQQEEVVPIIEVELVQNVKLPEVLENEDVVHQPSEVIPTIAQNPEVVDNQEATHAMVENEVVHLVYDQNRELVYIHQADPANENSNNNAIQGEAYQEVTNLDL